MTPPKHRAEDGQVPRPVDCEFGPADSDRPLIRRFIPTVGGFVLAFVATSVLSVFFLPIVEDVAEWRDRLFCPNILWCNTHLEFKATDNAQCTIGSIGTLVKQAIMDGDLAGKQYHGTRKSFAMRTYLCSDVSWQEKRAVTHLKELDDYHESCFVYSQQKEKEAGPVELSTFKVNTGKRSRACISHIWTNPNTGMFERTNSYKQALVFCMPNRDVSQREFSAEHQLPKCTSQDLQIVDFPDSLLAQ